jgi:hypothetical protein
MPTKNSGQEASFLPVLGAVPPSVASQPREAGLGGQFPPSPPEGLGQPYRGTYSFGEIRLPRSAREQGPVNLTIPPIHPRRVWRVQQNETRNHARGGSEGRCALSS